jgi:hypothetical protein
VTTDAQWCGQCYLPRGRAAITPAGYTATAVAPARPHQGAPEKLNPTVSTRWRKSATTYGPVGRILATTVLVVPFIFFVVVAFLTGGLCIFGAGLWGAVIMPMGLRDVWKVTQVPSG